MKIPIFLITATAAIEIQPEQEIKYDYGPYSANTRDLEKSRSVLFGGRIYKEWELSVDLKLDQNQHSTLSNVFALQAWGSIDFFLI